MNYKVEDRAGYTLVEGRIERNRAEALETVAKIERRLALEKLCRASGASASGPRTGSAAHLMNRRQSEPAAIFQISRSRGPDAPMATRSLYDRVTAWAWSFLKGERS